MAKSKEDFPGPNRREHRRLNVVVVVYTVVGRDDEEEKTTTRNVSAGGLCLIVSEDIAVGDELALKVFLPDGNSFIPAQGKVVWRKDIVVAWDRDKKHYELGVEFGQVEDSARKRIHQYVLSRLDES